MDNVDSVLQRLRRDLKRGEGKSGTAAAMAMGWAMATDWMTGWTTDNGRKESSK